MDIRERVWRRRLVSARSSFCDHVDDISISV